MVSNTRTLSPIVLLALVSCFCWSVGANVITTVPPVADTVAAPPNVVNEPTLAPAAAGHASVAPVIHKESVGHNTVVVPVTTTIAPAIVPAHSSAPSHTTSAPHATVSTSVKPIAATDATNAEPIVSTGTAALAGNAPAKETHCAGFCDYMKPICESLSKISSKQLFKIQTQFKQFVLKVSMFEMQQHQADAPRRTDYRLSRGESLILKYFYRLLDQRKDEHVPGGTLSAGSYLQARHS